MTTSQYKPIFISGVPRSGTTWVANILGSAQRVRLLSEPDNEKYSFIARKWKHSLHRFPYAKTEENYDHIKDFYQTIFSGKFPKNRSLVNHFLNNIFHFNSTKSEEHIIQKEIRIKNKSRSFISNYYLTRLLYYLTIDSLKSQKRLIIKSVHSGLCLSLIEKHFDPIIILILRHPANIIASCLELNIQDANRNLFNRPDLNELMKEYKNQINQLNDPLSKMGFQISFFYYIWEKQLENNTSKNWIIRSHEDLCINPVKKYQALYNELNLNWDNNIIKKIKNMNKPGEGFKTFRVLDDLKNKWKRTLNNDQISKIQKGYSILPVKYYEEFKI